MNPYVLLAGVIAFVLAVGAAGYRGYSLGSDHVRAEWAEAAAASVQAAQDNAERERAAARKAASTLQATLTKQRRMNGALTDSLTKHIAAIPATPAGCPPAGITAELFDDANNALAGPQGATGGSLPASGGTAAPAAGSVDSGANPDAGRDR